MTVVVSGIPTPTASRADPANFPARADATMLAIPAMVESMNLQNEENNALSLDVTTKHTAVMGAAAAVAANATNIGIVAANQTNVNTVAGNIANVNAVAGNIADVNTVAANAANIDAAAADIPSLSGKVTKTGDTMTGHLVVPANATGSQAPRKSEVVGLSGNETIAGIKTFSSLPVVPASATGTQAVRASETIRLVGGAARLPSWSTGGRPAGTLPVDYGYNSTLGCKERYNGTTWEQEGWQRGAPVAMSGASGVLSGVPAWANEVVAVVTAASPDGTTNFRLQVGGIGGLVTTGYTGGYSNTPGTQLGALTTHILFPSMAAAGEIFIRLECIRTGTTWQLTARGNFASGGAFLATASCPLNEALTQVGWSVAAGNADAGTIELYWRK